MLSCQLLVGSQYYQVVRWKLTGKQFAAWRQVKLDTTFKMDRLCRNEIGKWLPYAARLSRGETFVFWLRNGYIHSNTFAVGFCCTLILLINKVMSHRRGFAMKRKTAKVFPLSFACIQHMRVVTIAFYTGCSKWILLNCHIKISYTHSLYTKVLSVTNNISLLFTITVVSSHSLWLTVAVDRKSNKRQMFKYSNHHPL